MPEGCFLSPFLQRRSYATHIPCPALLLPQNLPPKDIARSYIMKLKVSCCRYMLGINGLTSMVVVSLAQHASCVPAVSPLIKWRWLVNQYVCS